MPKTALHLKRALTIALLVLFVQKAECSEIELLRKNNTMSATHVHRHINIFELIDCIIFEVGAVAVPGERDTALEEARNFSCISVKDNGPTIILEGNSDIFFDEEIISGFTLLTIPSKLVSLEMTVNLDDPLARQIVKANNRKRERSLRGANSPHRSLKDTYNGNFRILVVRVSDQVHSPSYEANEISDHVFRDKLTMTTQFRACSNNKLRFAKATGPKVTNGVFDVMVRADLTKAYDSRICVNAADDAISSRHKDDIGEDYDYIMYICPEVVNFGNAAGRADMGGNKSWYRDKFGSMPYVQMHEMGHNLMFFHSGEGELEYGDPTGIMGGEYEMKTDWGRMCFNAAKLFTAGWYSDHHFTIAPESLDNAAVNMVDVNAPARGNINSNDKVVVEVKGTGEDTMYFMLHRLEGMTRDMISDYVDTHANRVNIVKQASPGMPSKSIEHLAIGEEYTKTNWAGSGQTLHIKVCFIERSSNFGGAKVVIYLGEKNRIDCDNFDYFSNRYEYHDINDNNNCDDNNNYDNDDHDNDNDNDNDDNNEVGYQDGNEDDCQDSILKMLFSNNANEDGERKGCNWVAASNTESRCRKDGVASHCPKTCGTCLICADSGKRFRMKFFDSIKSCSWVSKNTGRCAKPGVARTCRSSCGTCS